MPTSTSLRLITERMLELLSDDDRRVIELRLAVARLTLERRSRLLDRFDGSFEAFADDMQAFIQAATSVSPGSHEDVLLVASHVAAYVETDEARFEADGKPSDSDELWDRNGAPYALDERGNPIHDAAMDYLAPPRTPEEEQTAPLRTEILAKVEQLRSVARFLRNDPIVSEDQDEIELFINSDDAMECDAIADRLLQ